MKVPYHQLGGKAKLLYDSFINWEKKQMNEQGELFGVHDWENVERANKYEKGITFIDYKFIRKNNYLIFDEELKLENLGMNEGDVLDVKLSDTNQVFFSIRKPDNAI